MSVSQRKVVYLGLLAANAALGAVVGNGGLSGIWASGAAVVSLLLAMAMKEFSPPSENPEKLLEFPK